jgi:tRNA-specific 2-thiouridylase
MTSSPPSGSDSALAALSGGVDSAVAAALLVEQGYYVVGVTLRMSDCASEAVVRARCIADRLGIPFHLLDARALFETQVVDYFVAEYAAGRTPNPCVVCNRAVKVESLIQHARSVGAVRVATGHYAGVRHVGGQYQLLRGDDRHKDQSYFLHALTQEQLRRVIFPLHRLSKTEVRAIARRYELPVAEQPDSQDLCFLAAGDYRDFLADRAPRLFHPGPICDRDGRVLGQHHGLPAYTVGRRKGLGIAAPEPLYVLAIEPDENTLIVGAAEELTQTVCQIDRVHIISGETPTAPFLALAQIRYRARATAVTVFPLAEGRAQVRFAAPQCGLTPGQFLVLYACDDQQVIGGGRICKPS